MAGQSHFLTALQRQLRALDDDALSALASVGLLRRARKDLAGLSPTFVADDGHVRVDLGPHQVVLDRRGPAGARCTCRAKTTCQHVLAACLFLAGTDAPAASGAAARAAPEAQEPQTLDEELKGIDLATLVDFAGKSVVREALELARAGETPVISMGAAITIRMKHPLAHLRYAGGGLGAFVTDYRGRHRKRVIVTAVLMYQLAHGVEVAPLDGQPREVPEGGTPEELAELRRALLPRVCQALTECVEIGLPHVAESFVERFASLSTVAAGAKFHRLALALNRIAELIDMQLERNAGADSSVLLDEFARTFALATALRSSAAVPREDLIGEARTSYKQVPELDLLCLGAYPWRTDSGYLGLTVLFWSAAQGRWFSLSESRPDGTIGFNPTSRYRSAGPWPGCDSPTAISGRHVRLGSALLNRLGRLSASARTRADVGAPTTPSDLDALAIHRWQEVERLRHDVAGVGLAEANPHERLVLLCPKQFGKQTFDATNQEFLWPILDEVGATLLLRLPYTEMSSHAIDRMEAMGERDIWALLCEIEISHWGHTLRPLVVLTNHPDRFVDCVYFDDAPSTSSGSMTSRLRNALSSLASRPGARAERVRQVSATDARLNALDLALVRLAERGTSAVGPGLTDVETELERLRQAGLSLVRQEPPGYGRRAPPTQAASLLKTRYAARIARELLDRV